MRRINLGAVLVFLSVLLVATALGYMAGVASASTDGGQTHSQLQALLGHNPKKAASALVDKAFEQLQDQYFMDLDDATLEKMKYAAVQGMLQPLRKDPFADDFTNFYDPEFYKNLMAETEGRYAGIGILMGVTSDGTYPEVNVVFPKTPAEEAGLVKGDVIIEVGGEDTFNMILPEVATKIKGEPGTKVKVKVFHPTSSEVSDLEIERREVQFSSVSDVQMLPNNVGYIKISNFAEDTGKDFRAGMDKLSGEGMKSVVIDLRDNPGGLLDAAKEVADVFVKNGPIVKVEFRNKQVADEVLEADPSAKKYDVPVLVLINANSASASEVLTSCLRDYKVAKVMGEKSFGKGVVQSVVPMEWETSQTGEAQGSAGAMPQPKSALAIVIGRYYTPQHKEIHKVGIQPDIWYDFQNLLIDDPTVKQYEDKLKTQREQMSQLRAQATQYMRDHDRTKDEAAKVAAALGRGEDVPDKAQIKPKEEEHSPLNPDAAPDKPSGITPEKPESPK